ncbi:FBP domain-containing protein [Microbacterium sp. NPDC076911]|uniref:FBP domain-containing protein n=1 Tax=Microbacterium sp. NPDC076911 TaxID=3154958 RepID=UPI0034385166
MRPLIDSDVRSALQNATADEMQLLALPADFLFADWDHLDFYAWRDPQTRGRGYVFAEIGGELQGVIVRAADTASRARSGLCNLCHTMQPGDQVSLFSARKGGRAGERGDSIGTYICADLSCHENVRLAAPLAPSEMRASVDMKIDGTRRRVESFVASVLDSRVDVS